MIQLPVDDSTLDRAVNHYGSVSQILMAIEEGSELTQALLHWLRDKASREHVQDEIADNLITALQMRRMFGATKVDERIRIKMERLESGLSNRDES